MILRTGRTCAAAALTGALIASSVPVHAQEPPPRPFLRKAIGLDESQLAAVERGEVVTKQLLSTDKAEIAAFGVVKTVGSPDLLIRLAADVPRFRQIPQIPEMGLFSSPPKLADLAGLHHPPADIAALKKCKPGSCDVKLGTKGLELIAKIDWSKPDAEAQAVAVFNQAIVDFVTAYAQGGTDALGDIQDKKAPKQRSEEYRALLANSPYLVEYVKEFNDYLEAYPKGKLADTKDILYWTHDTLGPKPVVSVFHMTIHKSARGAILANRLVAATHFFNAALEIMAAIPAQDGKGLYLIDLFRSRLDPPTGMLAGVIMGKVKGGLENGVRESLKMQRERLAKQAAP